MMKKVPLLLWIVIFQYSLYAQSTNTYDIVLIGGRVIDPETKLDAVKNIGIRNNKIAIITSTSLKGKEMINVSGLVVAPGFIDLHVHGRTNIEQEYQLHDGLTTALELEWGIENLKDWYLSRKDKAIINYGASVNWPYERFKAISKFTDNANTLLQKNRKDSISDIEAMTNTVLPAAIEKLSTEELLKTSANVKNSLLEGAIGIGAPIGYLPKSNPLEFYRLFEVASELKSPVFVHVRNPDIISVQEVINNAILTNTSLHIVHINSMAMGNIRFAVEMVATAQKKGFDITTELYPYTAASTGLQSAIFTEGWQERLGISYPDLQLVATGERLTKESFEKYRNQGGVVIIHMMKPAWIKTGIEAPGILIASDGMPYSKLAHPRTSGTFARVLGKYVREEKVLPLITALEKMTLLPAKRLEGISPNMKFKGRLQVGADADITIFNPNTITDKGSFETGPAFSEGVEYVIVNGIFALKYGKTVPNVFAGQPIYGKYKSGKK
jgi:dihydroorotase-like cyclic amidohydrolase